jgi:protein SCO1
MVVQRPLRSLCIALLAFALAGAAPLGVLAETKGAPFASPADTTSAGRAGTVPSALVAAASVGPAPALADLVNPDGSPFDLASLAGHPTLLFFGYTHCPDVCPLTIGEIIGVFEAQPEARAVFVSIDPERDTPAFLTDWSAYLPEGLHPVTGSLGAVRRAADGFGVRYARVETSSAAGYTFSHTADVFLIDGRGQLLGTFPFGTSGATMAADVAAVAADIAPMAGGVS